MTTCSAPGLELTPDSLRAINAARCVGVGTGVYGWSPGRGGVHHHRIAEPLRVLADAGVTTGTGLALTDEILSGVDTILVHTLHGEHESEAWEDLARIGTHRLVYDVDDWMWAPDYRPFKTHYTPAVLDRLFRNVTLSHVVTTPSPAIAEHLSRFNPNVHVVPNTVPAWVLDHTMPARERPTIGWQVSDSHLADVTPHDVAGVARFLGRAPDWDVHTYGALRFGAGPGLASLGRVRHTNWIASVADYYRTISLDIGLGPARRTPFNLAKSALRAVEYAALGIVAVLPDLPIYRGWVTSGVTGVLVRHTSQPSRTIAGVLRDLAANPHALVQMADAARRRARDWTTEANVRKWVEAWQTA